MRGNVDYMIAAANLKMKPVIHVPCWKNFDI